MIFGKSDQEKRDTYNKYYKELQNKQQRCFAYMPKKLTDGTYIWLEYYYKLYFITDTYGCYVV